MNLGGSRSINFRNTFSLQQRVCRILFPLHDMSSSPPSKKLIMSKPMKIGTHNGTFHCDEALACSMLQMLPKYKDAEIIRSRNPSDLDICNVVVDVGGVFDPSNHRYDHHQRTFDESMKSLLPGKKWSTKLSSAGLIYCHFGKEIIAHILSIKNKDDPKVNIVFDKVYQNFIEEIDAIDNGINICDGPQRYFVSTSLSSRVKHLNPTWLEKSTEEKARECFNKAMKLVSTEFLDRIHFFSDVWWPAREIVEKAIQSRKEVDASGEIIDFGSSCCPWTEHLFDIEEKLGLGASIKYVIYQDVSGDNWRVQCVPVKQGSFENRLSLPKTWCGLRDEELSKAIGLPGAIFVHMSGFIGGHKTREGVLLMARKALAS